MESRTRNSAAERNTTIGIPSRAHIYISSCIVNKGSTKLKYIEKWRGIRYFNFLDHCTSYICRLISCMHGGRRNEQPQVIATKGPRKLPGDSANLWTSWMSAMSTHLPVLGLEVIRSLLRDGPVHIPPTQSAVICSGLHRKGPLPDRCTTDTAHKTPSYSSDQGTPSQRKYCISSYAHGCPTEPHIP